MNKMVVIWMILAAVLAVRSFSKPSYAVSFYMLTFFAHPVFWWWGDMIRGYRWNLYAGVLLLFSLFMTRADDAFTRDNPLRTNTARILGFLVLNIIVVHVLFAANPDSSIGWIILRLKFVLLFFLLQYAIRDERDYRIVTWAIVLGMGYIGYEATIQGRGHFSGGRLEGIGAAGVDSSNQLASLLVTALPLGTTLLFTAIPKWQKAAVVVLCACAFNVVLLCNSRGSFLGALLAGVVFMAMASGPARKRSLRLAALALVGTLALLRDPEIINRFMTTFNEEAERDNSAESRLLFWGAGLRMLANYPFGSGGNSFSTARGWRFMPGGTAGAERVGDTRALHNGYVTEATDYGVQGFTLTMLFIGSIWVTALRGRRAALKAGDANAVMIYALFAAAVTAWMVSSMFGDYLDEEWSFWTAAMAHSYLRLQLFASAQQPTVTTVVEEDRPLIPLQPAVGRTAAR